MIFMVLRLVENETEIGGLKLALFFYREFLHGQRVRDRYSSRSCKAFAEYHETGVFADRPDCGEMSIIG
jgi:hypothetical protein